MIDEQQIEARIRTATKTAVKMSDATVKRLVNARVKQLSGDNYDAVDRDRGDMLAYLVDRLVQNLVTYSHRKMLINM